MLSTTGHKTTLTESDDDGAIKSLDIKYLEIKHDENFPELDAP